MSEEMRREFVEWFTSEKFGGFRESMWESWQAATALANKKHAAAIDAADRRYTASQIVTGRCSPDCPMKLQDAPGICYSAFCALKHKAGSLGDDSEEQQS